MVSRPRAWIFTTDSSLPNRAPRAAGDALSAAFGMPSKKGRANESISGLQASLPEKRVLRCA